VAELVRFRGNNYLIEFSDQIQAPSATLGGIFFQYLSPRYILVVFLEQSPGNTLVSKETFYRKSTAVRRLASAKTKYL
jgi:hypothetical protein